MLRRHEATPCPVPLRGDEVPGVRSDRLMAVLEYGDTMSKIDFTKEFPKHSYVVGVKRPATATRSKRSCITTDFAIHEDDGASNTKYESRSLNRQRPTGPKLSILAQPAQRPRSGPRFAPANANNDPPESTTLMQGTHVNESSNIETHEGVRPTLGKIAGRVHAGDEVLIQKPARRGTIYIPPEDTTMPTVWMGLFSPIKKEESPCRRSADLTSVATHMTEAHARPKQSVRAAPQRAPLRHSVRPPQERTICEDIPGRMTGKENLPPGQESIRCKTVEKRILGEPSRKTHQATRRSAADRNRKTKPSSGVRDNVSAEASISAQLMRTREFLRLQQEHVVTSSDNDVSASFARLRLNGGGNEAMRSSRSDEAFTDAEEKTKTRIITPVTARSTIDQKYPLLCTDVENASLYEDNWLAHQEIAITQLVNGLFDGSDNHGDNSDLFTIRSKLSMIHQDQSSVLLHKRLQASILYGALSMPKEELAKASRLPEDLGLKERFLSLWLDTFDPLILQAGAEVVIGRECSSVPKTSAAAQTGCCLIERKASRQSISQYLEMFLVRNEDVCPHNGMLSPGAKGVQRTLLRSLMLIRLLDTAKTSPQMRFPRCIFHASSAYKTSVAVVQGLMQLLHPTAGNVVRSLVHLGFSVAHIQSPLQEYVYHIDNLATDLRDGVRLTRLIEHLLYPSTSSPPLDAGDGGATTTVRMPPDEVLSTLQGEHEWPLSKHLKFPCSARATKLYNVQIALSALSGIKGIDQVVEDIKAEHIVDGFREKTVALLWGLTSKWGLGRLIDWADVKHEILRLGHKFDEDDDDDGDDLLRRQQNLLRKWATVIAARQGVTVQNLTTSFADGRIFEAIVDEYEPYLRAPKYCGGSRPKVKEDLSRRLLGVGCSAEFAHLFARSPHHAHAHRTGKFFDRDFTLVSLSFLASRLLSASRRARAATMIQRWWRSTLRRMERNRRAVAKILASECRVLVVTRDRLAWAKGVIWKCWKSWKERRVGGSAGAGAGAATAGAGTRETKTMMPPMITEDVWLLV